VDPLVSIVLPAYNGEKVIRECLDSVVNQEYGNFEVIVVDDGSTDGTAGILAEYKDSISLCRQENHGFSHAISKGISLARGKYISFIGQDDVYLPDKTRIQVEILESHPDCALTHSPAIHIDENGKVLYEWGGYKAIYRWGQREKHVIEGLFYYLYLNGDFIIHPSVMLRRDALAEFGDFPFDPSLRIASDYFLYLRLAAKYLFYEYERPLVKFRRWKEQLTSAKETIYPEDREVLSRVKKLLGGGSFKFLLLYSLAMSNRCFSEALRYFVWKKPIKAAGFLFLSFLYFPLNVNRFLLTVKRACEALFRSDMRKAYAGFLKEYK